MRLWPACAVLSVVLLFALGIGCGGGGGGSTPSGPSQITVTVTPSSATVPAGSSQPFTAVVSNNTAVIWQVNGITGGNAILGTIATTGVYVAPLSPPSVGQVTIKAISQVDSSKSNSAIAIPVFSNASVIGSYVFKAITTNGTSFSFAGGVFTGDGNGAISSGIEDANNSVGGPSTNVAFSGSYSVGADGRSVATISSALGTSTFRFVLISSTSGELIEFDNTTVTSGFLLAQDTSAISSIAGTFVFSFQGEDIGTAVSGPLSSVGQVVLDGIGGASGTQDVNDIGTFSANVAFAGPYSVGAQGRGTAALTSSSGTSNYVFYIIDARRLEFINVNATPGLIESGAAIAQQTVAFNNASLGPSVFSAEWR